MSEDKFIEKVEDLADKMGKKINIEKLDIDKLDENFGDYLKNKMAEMEEGVVTEENDDIEVKENYPQLVLRTDGTYDLLIEEGVSVKFKSPKDVEDFTKNKNFAIHGGYPVL